MVTSVEEAVTEILTPNNLSGAIDRAAKKSPSDIQPLDELDKETLTLLNIKIDNRIAQKKEQKRRGQLAARTRERNQLKNK